MSRAILIRSTRGDFLAETTTIVLPAVHESGTRHPGVPAGIDAVADGGRLAPVIREFTDIKKVISACGQELFDAIQQIPHPGKVSVEFGLTLGGETGVPFLTKATGEANFKITIDWTFPEVTHASK
jgi:hypothetical protein